MAAKGKKKTTMAKLNRERALQERRMEKQVKKEMRKRAAAAGPEDSPPTPAEPLQ
ncbi:MAG TPA: hypothetical protein VFX80_04760 [Solirubrobacteraceae bacterium]|nr:hypothetical protein [Solirubrobacteraceae bacterium]